MLTASPERLLVADTIDRDSLVITRDTDALHLGPLATSVPLEMTIDGTATVTINVDEEDVGQLKALMGGFFKPDNAGHLRLSQWNTLPVYGSTYVLREMERNEDGSRGLVSYDQASELMKQFTGPFKVSRGQRTRPEVAGMLTRQAGVPAWIPDRHDRSIIHQLAPADLKALRQGRPSKNGDAPILVAVDAARQAGFRGETLVNMVAISGRETGDNYDPTVQNLKPPDHSIGLWQINQLAVHGKYGTDEQLKDPYANARAAKKMFDAAGYSPWKGQNGSWRDGVTTARMKRARAAVNKGIDTGGPNGITNVDRAYVERFEFTVGKHEDYWTAEGRMASDVKWNRYAVFNTNVFANDLTLAADLTPYEFDESDEWVDKVRWTVTGRQRIDEMVITGRLAAIIPPGAAFHATDATEPTWGTWIVENFKRTDLLDPECGVEVTLRRPRAPLAEPSSTVKTVSGGGGSVLKQIGPNWNPKAVIDRLVLPIGRENGCHAGGPGGSLTPANVAAANATHSALTVDGNPSEHKGPPSRCWAVDMFVPGGSTQGGHNPRGKKVGDAVYKAVCEAFDIDPHPGQIWNTLHKVAGGRTMRWQLIWQTLDGGNHYDHVHVGVSIR